MISAPNTCYRRVQGAGVGQSSTSRVPLFHRRPTDKSCKAVSTPGRPHPTTRPPWSQTSSSSPSPSLSPAFTVSLPDLVNIFKLFIPQLLSYPNPTDPLNGEAAALLMRDPKAYENRIRDCVRLHASDPVHLDGTPVAVVPPPATAANANTNANTAAAGGSASSSSSGGGASASSSNGSDESDVSSSSDEQPAASSANATDGANGTNNDNSNVAIDKEGGNDDATMGEAPVTATAAGTAGDAKRRVAVPGNNDAADGGASSSRSSSGSDFMMEVCRCMWAIAITAATVVRATHTVRFFVVRVHDLVSGAGRTYRRPEASACTFIS